MAIVYPKSSEMISVLRRAEDSSVDFIVVVSSALDACDIPALKLHLDESARALRPGGLLFVQGLPDYLPELGVHLDGLLEFKYWIALESTILSDQPSLPTVHAGLLLFNKGNGRFDVKQTRFPHQHCEHCKRPLKDWGGKAHLMHPSGRVISDVWKELPITDNYSQISRPSLETILAMMDPRSLGSSPNNRLSGIVGPAEGIGSEESPRSTVSFDPPPNANRSSPRESTSPVDAKSLVIDQLSLASELGETMTDVVHCGDAVEVLAQYPDDSVDLAFADPPYNLDKSYSSYDDELDKDRYLSWCEAWLAQYVRVLKPTGSLYVLNLPRWTMHHAKFLRQRMHLQNWIVWDALSEPRGKLMPAHYGLLFCTKHPTRFTFNYELVGDIDSRMYCLRGSCIRRRKVRQVDEKEPLTDLWWDIHRIKHRRDRDHHPCQLPDALMERIIRLSTNPGDVVLDALCGAGTTPVIATKLGRRYVAIDVDEFYVDLTRRKIAEVSDHGNLRRESLRRSRRKHTKKELQLELRHLAARLGRLPTPEDVAVHTEYDARTFLDAFPSWGKALKAAKLEVLAS